MSPTLTLLARALPRLPVLRGLLQQRELADLFALELLEGLPPEVVDDHTGRVWIDLRPLTDEREACPEIVAMHRAVIDHVRRRRLVQVHPICTNYVRILHAQLLSNTLLEMYPS